nr:hypothetical protein [Bryobacter sp.]
GAKAGWNPGDTGHWEVEVARDGEYDLTVRFPKATEAGTAGIQLGEFRGDQPFAAGAESATIAKARLRRGPATLTPSVQGGGKGVAPTYVDVKRR